MDWTKRDIETIVNRIVDDKIKRATKNLTSDKEVKAMINSDINAFHDTLKRKGHIMTDKETKDMIRKTMINLYKFMWEKSNFFVKSI